MTNSPASGLEPTTHWASVWAILSCGLAAALQVGKVAVALPNLESDLGIGLAAGGWVMGIFALMGAVAGTFAGAVDSRFGAKHVMIAGCLFLVAGSAAGALADTLAPLLATRILEGAGFLTISISAPALLQRRTAPKARDFVLALWTTCTPVGLALVFLVGPAFPSWRYLWFTAAILAGVSAVALAFAPDRLPTLAPASRSDGGLLSDARTTLAARAPTTLALIFGTFSLQYFAVFALLPTFLVHSIGVSLQVAGALVAPIALVNALGNLTAGVLMSRGVAARTLTASGSLAMGATGAAIFLSAGPPGFIIVCCLLFSATGGLIPASVFATAPVAAPEPRLTPLTVGLIVQGSCIGQVVGPVVAGAIVQAFGWHAAPVPIAIAAALGIGLSMLLVAP